MNWMHQLSEEEKRELLYWLLSKQLLDIPYQVVAEVDTIELENRMKAIDWNCAFYDPLHDHIELESEEDKHLFTEVENIVLDLQNLEAAGNYSLVAAQLLQIKYWQYQDMEIQISGIQDKTMQSPIEQDIPAKFLRKLYEKLKSEKMKEETFDYLSNEIKYGGFDESTIPALREALLKGDKKFELSFVKEIGKTKDVVEAKLNFIKSTSDDKYFFTSFDLKIAPGGDTSKSFSQHIPRQKDERITLKQGYNLAMSRPVGIVTIDNNKQVHEKWAIPDKKFTYEDGSPTLKILPATYGYSIESTLSKYNILELRDDDERTSLFNSVRRGNLSNATAERSDGMNVKVLLAANPLGRSINIYDASSGEKLNHKVFLKQEVQEQSEQQGKE